MILCTDTILPAGQKCRHAPGDFAEGKIHVSLSGSSDEDHLAVRQISSEAARQVGNLLLCHLPVLPSEGFRKAGFPGKGAPGLVFSPFNIKTNSIKKVF